MTSWGDVRLSGLLRDADGGANWVEFGAGDPDDWTSIQKADALSSGGAFMNGLLYVTSGNYMYAIDPDRFTVTNLGIISDQWAWTDAAPALAVGEIGNRLLAVCQNGTTLELISPEKRNPDLFLSERGCSHCWRGLCLDRYL